MAISFPRVGPGDVIRSDFVNTLLDTVESLDSRLTALERGGPSTGGAPLIASLSPVGDVGVGSKLTLTGAHFLVPAQQNTVSLGPAAITQFFADSTDTVLSFLVPAELSGVLLPALLPVQVRNRNGDSNPVIVRVVPAGVIPHGSSLITNTTASIGVVQAGGTYTLQYRLQSTTDIPENYALSPVFSDLQGTASLQQWIDAARLVPTGQPAVSSDTPLPVTLTVTLPPGATSGSVALQAKSIHNDSDLTRTSQPLTLTVGSVPDISDSRITIDLPDVGVATPNSRIATINGQRGLEVKYTQQTTMLISAKFAEDGLYRFAAEIADPGAGTLWSLGAVDPAKSREPSQSVENVGVALSCLATGPSDETRTLVMRIFRRNDTDTTDVWQSFLRIPIRGF